MLHSLEPLIMIVRAGRDHHKFGDPFEFVATIMIDGGVAHIKGANGELPSKDTIKSFFNKLKSEYGVKKFKWEHKGKDYQSE